MGAFVTNIFNTIYNNLISGGAYYLILKGVAVTFVMTVASWVIALILGVLISFLECYSKRVISGIGRALCFIFRSVPVLLVMWLFYYCIFGGSSADSMMIAALAIGLYGGGHVAEILSRAAAKEQAELSQGIRNKLEKVYYVTVVPQALEDSIFELKRICVLTLQWSAVSGYIAANDLTKVMYGIGHRTMYPFFSIFFAAICYLIAVALIEGVFTLIDHKIHKEA